MSENRIKFLKERVKGREERVKGRIKKNNRLIKNFYKEIALYEEIKELETIENESEEEIQIVRNELQLWRTTPAHTPTPTPAQHGLQQTQQLGTVPFASVVATPSLTRRQQRRIQQQSQQQQLTSATGSVTTPVSTQAVMPSTETQQVTPATQPMQFINLLQQPDIQKLYESMVNLQLEAERLRQEKEETDTRANATNNPNDRTTANDMAKRFTSARTKATNAAKAFQSAIAVQQQNP